jgi:MFS superfamily sulfate permease-like transporter
LVKTYGVEVMPWITIIVGIYIYIAGLFKWHHLSDFIPVYVIEGFLLGIASLFFLSYSDYMFGLTDNHSNRGVELYESYYDMYVSFF